MVQDRKLQAEFLGTFWLVLCGCGSAVLASTFPNVGIGLLGVSLAFGLSLMTMAYAVGPISGGHFNPAVTVGLWVAGKFPQKDVLKYIAAQVCGAILASACLYLIASGKPGFDALQGFAANGYGVHSPGGYSVESGLLSEFVFTFMFLIVILGVTGQNGIPSAAPFTIGFALALIHLVTIPITNTSVNPARSTGPALFAGGWAIGQLWLFWLAPLIGAATAGLAYKYIAHRSDVRKSSPIAQRREPILSPSI